MRLSQKKDKTFLTCRLRYKAEQNQQQKQIRRQKNTEKTECRYFLFFV